MAVELSVTAGSDTTVVLDAEDELGSADVMSTAVVLGAIVELAGTTLVFIDSVMVKVENALRPAVVVFV